MKRILLVLAILVVPCALPAQGWSRLANGQIQYSTDYTTTGLFSCGSNPFFAGTCSASGNHVTLTSGESVLDIIFAGASGPVVATSEERHVVTMGTLTVMLSGQGPFVFGTAGKPGAIFGLALTVSNAEPAEAATFYRGFLATGTEDLIGNCCWPIAAPAIALDLPEPPAFYPAHNLDMIYRDLTPISFSAADGSLLLQAQVGLIPEPGSFVLLTTGLVVLAAACSWRTRET